MGEKAVVLFRSLQIFLLSAFFPAQGLPGSRQSPAARRISIRHYLQQTRANGDSPGGSGLPAPITFIAADIGRMEIRRAAADCRLSSHSSQQTSGEWRFARPQRTAGSHHIHRSRHRANGDSPGGSGLPALITFIAADIGRMEIRPAAADCRLSSHSSQQISGEWRFARRQRTVGSHHIHRSRHRANGDSPGGSGLPAPITFIAADIGRMEIRLAAADCRPPASCMQVLLSTMRSRVPAMPVYGIIAAWRGILCIFSS